jgi:hypothetical protein
MVSERGVSKLQMCFWQMPSIPQSVPDAIEAASPTWSSTMTWRPANSADLIKSMPNDTRPHREGGANLLIAAEALGVKRYVMESRGFYLDATQGNLADERVKLRYDDPSEIGESARVSERMKISLWARPRWKGWFCTMVSSMAPALGPRSEFYTNRRRGSSEGRQGRSSLLPHPPDWRVEQCSEGETRFRSAKAALEGCLSLA